MSYQFPEQDAQFVLNKLVDFPTLCTQLEQAELNDGLADAILEEAAKLGADVLAPLNSQGDSNGATISERGVEESPGFNAAYQQFVENGWPALAGEVEYGGQGLPRVLATAVMEIWQSANMAFSLCPLLTQGAIEAVSAHGSSTLKAVYLPKLISGEWTATMNLTEPDAGSDLAAIKAKADPCGDHYLIRGQKIFITWGDHQMTDNIAHLVLARLPDAPAGVKGISLFLVPKYLVNADGSLGEKNDVQAVSLEHKLGIHASPTCVMSYGDNAGAIGYLVGKPHAGLACMFTMMNDARQGVGLQGVAISERAYQLARSYAKERIQGTLKDGSRQAIIEHPDVRRMLMFMKSGTEAARALAYVAAAESDRLKAAQLAGDNAAIARHQARLDLYTPIVKGWITELAQEITYQGVQIHGGMGFIEETGAAQHYRDARILTIYEGTTGIQGLDFVGRKTLADKGAALSALLADIEKDCTNGPQSFASAALQQHLAHFKQTLEWLAANPKEAPAVGVNFMLAAGYLCGAWLLLKSADAAQNTPLVDSKAISARFFCEHLLPRVQAHLNTVQAGSESLMALDQEQF